ncbi:MAG: hypothetical protein P1P63_00040 [Treponemataceae bacterium]
MIKANIGSVEIAEKTILSGNNHLVVSYPVKDGLKNLKAGTAVKIESGEVEHLTADTDDAIGVLYKSVELADGKTTKDDTALVVIFGAVKKSAVTFTDAETACSEQLVEKLRKNGVYAIN